MKCCKCTRLGWSWLTVSNYTSLQNCSINYKSKTFYCLCPRIYKLPLFKYVFSYRLSTIAFFLRLGLRRPNLGIQQIFYELLTNFLRTSYKLLTNFLQTSYKLLTNFLQASNKLLTIFLQTSYNFLQTYKLFTINFLQTYHKLLTNILLTSYQLDLNFLQTLSKLLLKFLQTSYIHFTNFSKKVGPFLSYLSSV
jgi:hypothetical protein